MRERVAFSADLNASPLPKLVDEQLYEKLGKVECAQGEHVESAVEIMRRVCDISYQYSFLNSHALVILRTVCSWLINYNSWRNPTLH